MGTKRGTRGIYGKQNGLCNIWKNGHERPYAGGVSMRSRNGALRRQGCVVNDQMTKVINEYTRSPP